jgi:hypothetical protein
VADGFLRDARDHVMRSGPIASSRTSTTNPQNPRVESPQEICDLLVRAADFIPKERLGATDDCGFSPFSIDEKPLARLARLRPRCRVCEDRQPRRGHEDGRREDRRADPAAA